MSHDLSRRQFFGSSLALPVLGAAIHQPGAAAESSGGGDYKIYWGDLHNHNAVGYAQGSLERTFEIARNILDFHAFTPHSQWHDMPDTDPKTREKFFTGFKVTKERWPEVQRICAEYHDEGRFVTFPGYEWHSSGYGDYCLVFPQDNAPLQIFDDLRLLQDFARKEGIIIVPHHAGNRRGNRGANFDTMDTGVSPVLEVYSEWGNAERDNAPFPYIRHSHGGVWAQNTYQFALESGLRLGAIASTDDHLGHPGAYGEGLAAVLAPELTRAAIFEAVKQRRTYGVTGDRMRLDYRLNGAIMGQSILYAKHRELTVGVSGWDEIAEVEVVKNNHVIHREHPIDNELSTKYWENSLLLRVQFGWGPWGSLDTARVCDWKFRVELDGGTLSDIQPCFQSGPLDESRRDRITERTTTSCVLQSFTSRKQAFAEDDTKAIVLRLAGGPDTRVRIMMESPKPMQIELALRELESKNEVVFMGTYPSESIKLHRVVFAERSSAAFTFTDTGRADSTDWYYVRVRQTNGHLAWSSPVWVDARTGPKLPAQTV